MSIGVWLRLRGVELLASLCAAALLVGGAAAGIPYLRARIPEIFIYSFCCVAAVLLRAVIDLAIRGSLVLVHAVHGAPAGAVIEAPLTA
jgi:hypothetical protein